MGWFACVYATCVWLVNGVGLRVVYFYNLFFVCLLCNVVSYIYFCGWVELCFVDCLFRVWVFDCLMIACLFILVIVLLI